jgi:hypothetical protein
MVKVNAICSVIALMLLIACGGNEAPAKQEYRFVSPHVKDGRQRVSDDRHFGFTDGAGNEVVPLKYDAARDFSEGLAMVSVYKGDGELKQIACGYIDTTGKEVIALQYRHALDFGEGLAAVQNFDNKWGYINKSGTMVIPFEFDDASPFDMGKAFVKRNGKLGFIDTAGTMTITGDAPPDTATRAGW